MKKRVLALLLVLTACCAAASAQTLPGVECFSPGLVKLARRMQENPAMHMTAQAAVEDALYARDLSVLGDMLSGTSFVYDAAGNAQIGADRLEIVKNDEALFSATLSRAGSAAALELGGQVYGVSLEGEADALKLGSALAGTSILERVMLEDIAAWLTGLKAGDTLLAGYTVEQPFGVERTMSDDGTRLTMIKLSGSVVREGEAVWMISGWMRQPAGKAPKDTMELTFTQDEQNFLEIAYSSTRQSEITAKNKAGTAKADTSMKVSGKLSGYAISSRLTVYLRNVWTADGENLTEKVSVNSTLTHQDRRPQSRYARINDIEASVKNVIRLTTAETDETAPVSLEDALTVDVKLDGNTFAAGTADLSITVGGEAADLSVPIPTQIADEQTLDAAVSEAVRQLAASLYGTLGKSALDKVQKGL